MEINKHTIRMMLETRDQMAPLKKPNNVILIEIDGLDCCGKETFSKSLEIELDKMAVGLGSNTVIERISFPRYDFNDYGKEIYKELRRENKEYSREELDMLYYMDRYVTMKELYGKAKDESCLYVFILDRFVLSNCIYTHLTAMNTDTETVNKATKYAYNTLKFEVNKLGKVDIVALMYRNPNSQPSRDLQSKLLQMKSDTDTNERMEVQDFLADILYNRIMYNDMRFLNTVLEDQSKHEVNTFRIPIGATFNGNIMFESMICSTLKDMFLSYKLVNRYRKYEVELNIIDGFSLLKDVTKFDAKVFDESYYRMYYSNYDDYMTFSFHLPHILPIYMHSGEDFILVSNPDKDKHEIDKIQSDSGDVLPPSFDTETIFSANYKKEIICEFESGMGRASVYGLVYPKKELNRKVFIKATASNTPININAGMNLIGFIRVKVKA